MEENNQITTGRLGFLKTAALAGAALALPGGVEKLFATGSKQPETAGDDTNAALIT